MKDFLVVNDLQLNIDINVLDQSLLPLKLTKYRTLTYIQDEYCYFVDYSCAIIGKVVSFALNERDDLPKPFPVKNTNELYLLDNFLWDNNQFLLIILFMKKEGFQIPEDLKPNKLKKIAKELNDTIDPEYPFKDIIEPKVMTITTLDGKLIIK
jgi:hypothetical protein